MTTVFMQDIALHRTGVSDVGRMTQVCSAESDRRTCPGAHPLPSRASSSLDARRPTPIRMQILQETKDGRPHQRSSPQLNLVTSRPSV